MVHGPAGLGEVDGGEGRRGCAGPRRGRSAYRLDGDNLRHGICDDLGFSAAARQENVRRAGEIAHLFADAGTVALVSLISPYADGRRAARELLERDGLAFVEVFVNTPVDECARRDPKGLYARAAAGDLEGLTGVDAPYEPPAAPDVELTPRPRASTRRRPGPRGART